MTVHAKLLDGQQELEQDAMEKRILMCSVPGDKRLEDCMICAFRRNTRAAGRITSCQL
jgi:hypothetical protein